MARYCSQCGSELKNGMQVCNNCGTIVQDIVNYEYYEKPAYEQMHVSRSTSSVSKTHIIISVIIAIALVSASLFFIFSNDDAVDKDEKNDDIVVNDDPNDETGSNINNSDNSNDTNDDNSGDQDEDDDNDVDEDVDEPDDTSNKCPEAIDAVSAYLTFLINEDYNQAFSMMMEGDGSFIDDDTIDQLVQSYQSYSGGLDGYEISSCQQTSYSATYTGNIYIVYALIDSTYNGESYSSNSTFYTAQNTNNMQWGLSYSGFSYSIDPDPYETDDFYSQSTTLTENVEQTHNIHENDDVDWFTFSLTESATVTVQTSGISNNDDTEIYLYDSSGVPDSYLESDDDGGDGLWSKIERSLSAGTYYVKVQELSQSDTIDSYTISFSLSEYTSNPDSYEDDDYYYSSTYLYDGAFQTHSIHENDDVDWYRFTIYDQSTVTIETSGSSYDDTEMYLYDSSGVPDSYLEYDDYDGTYEWSKIERTLNSGTYYIKIQEDDQDNTIDSYSIGFTVEILQGTLSADSYEPDNNYYSATTLSNGISQTHNIHENDDVDWYTFELYSSSSVTITTSGYSGDTEMYLYDSSGVPYSYLEYNDDSEYGGLWSRIETSLSSGTYYVKITSFGESETIDEYNIQLDIT